MELSIEKILLIASILLFAGILASKTSGKTGLPALLLFLGIGIIAGSDVLGLIYFDDSKLAQSLGIISLSFILFSGGLDTKWEAIKPVIGQGITLSTLGVMLTTLSLGAFVSLLTDFSLLEGLLLGAIVSSTDAAAVFSILRFNKIGLREKLRPTLELESGSNDPMAFFLTIALTSLLVNKDQAYLDLIPLFVIQMFLGGGLGLLFGKVIVFVINKINLEYEALYPVLIFSIVLFTFSFTTFVNGNGFLAVYVAALYLGNKSFVHKKTVLKFFDGISWLFQIVMFVTLGLLVFPKQIIPIIGIGLLTSAFLIFVARPIGVFFSLLFFKMKWNEKAFISWVGLRGAVPIVFATYPLIAGVEKSGMIFNIVFFIVVTSVLLQGTTLKLMARLLGVVAPQDEVKPYPLDIEMSEDSRSELIEVELDGNSIAVGKKLMDLGFPKGSLIVTLNKGSDYLTPIGSTVLEKGDKMLILANTKEDIPEILLCLGGVLRNYNN